MKFVMVLIVMGGVALAQDEKKDDLESVIVDITGTVDIKRPSDKDWIAAEKNMKLGKGSEICTAEASSVKLLFPPQLTIEVKPITLTKIDELAKTAKGMKTDVKLKFGSVNIELKKGEVESSLRVATPNATTSVSGSSAQMWGWAASGGGYLNVSVQTGSWSQQNNGTGGTQEFGPGQVGNDNGNLFGQIEGNYSAGQYQDYFGRPEGELYDNWDPCSGLNPNYEGGDPNLNPFADVFQQPSALPGPPGLPN